MKTINYIYFYSIFFTLYGLLNYYLFIRGAQALPANPAVRAVYTAVFLTLALAFIAGRTLENYWLSPVSETLTYIGSLWLAVMLYGILSVFLLDICGWGDSGNYAPFWAPCGGANDNSLSQARDENFLAWQRK